MTTGATKLSSCIFFPGLATIKFFWTDDSRWRVGGGVARFAPQMSKAAKHRSCPAAQREITSAECGENRASRYACPAECVHNPFAPERYDEFLELEREVILKAADWHLDTSPDRAAALLASARMAGKPPAECHALEMFIMFFERDAQGRTFAERWEAARFPGLNNDERVVFRAMARPRLRLVEVHRVLDDMRTEVVDLFEAGAPPFIVYDRSLTIQACRFASFVGWFYELPHFSRVSGIIALMPEFGTFEPDDAMKEIIRHLGGPAAEAEFADWFARNSVRFQEALMATYWARREAMFSNMDLEFGKAVYELRAPFAECRTSLDGIETVAADALMEGERDEGFAEARVWFDDAPAHQPATPDAQPALGRVLLGQAHWRLEALGAERLGRLRSKFESVFGEHVRFTGERRDNMAAHLKGKEPKYNRALVPPRLLEQPKHLHLSTSRVALPGGAPDPDAFLSDFLEQENRAWPDHTVPALNDRTPREAANDPALRPTLIRLLKNRVRTIDEENLREDANVDINWLLRELGAHEIIFDPPPNRTPPAPGQHRDDILDEALDDDDLDEPLLDDPPPLPDEPFDIDESIERMTVALDEFESVEEAIDAMEEARGFLVEDARELVGTLLNDVEFTLLSGYLTQLWFVFVPPGCRGPVFEMEDSRAAYGRQLHGLVTGPNEKMEIAFEKSAQPTLLKAFTVQILRDAEELPQGDQVRPENRTLFLLLLNAAIEQLDSALRTGPTASMSESESEVESDVIELSSDTNSTNDVSPVNNQYEPPLAPLLTRGQPRSKEIGGSEYASLGITREHVPELVRLALDEALNDGPTESTTVWAPVHAWRALGELRAEEAIEPLLGLLRRIDEKQDDWVNEQLPRVFARIGPAAIEPVSNYLANPAHGEWARVSAGQALRFIGEAHPEARAICVATLTRQLGKFSEQSDTLNAFLVSPLIDLRAVESAPVMERAFAAGRVDESVCGDYEDAAIELGLKTKREHRPKPNKLTMLFDPIRRKIGLPASEEALDELESPDYSVGAIPKAHIAAPKVGRNDACPCGSGKKFKKCCGK